MDVEISIVIPSYNESKNLPIFLKNVEKIYEQDYNLVNYIEIILVNNGSNDQTKNIILNHNLYKKKLIKFLNIEVNQGYGNGIIEGIRIAKGQCIGWTHADNQTDFKDLIYAFKKNKEDLIKSKILVKGLRVNRNIFDAFFTKAMSIFVFLFLGYKVSDINAQPKIFNRSLTSFFQNPPLDFSLDLYLLLIAKKNKIKIIEYPVYFNKRLLGEAKGGGSIKGKMKLVFRTINYIIKLKYKWKL